MGCFGKGRAEVVPTEDAVSRKGAGRLESSDGKATPRGAARDGLHSAPTSQDRTDAALRRHGLHSAPHAVGDKGAKGHNSDLGDFILEAADGSPPTKEAVDAYLEDIIGPKITKLLRNAEWAARVEGLEALSRLVKQRAGEGSLATGGLDSSAQDENGRLALFRACVTVMARALSDKVVPVYLPTLALLAEVYSSAFLAPIATSKLPRAGIGCFAHQLVFRAGSSNVRAREESQGALLQLARCDAVGAESIFPLALKSVNAKSAHATQGRLELLRNLVGEFGMGAASGLQMSEVLNWLLPLCECASDKSRDLAFGLLLDVRAHNPSMCERLIDEIRPSVMPVLKTRLAPPAANQTLSLSGKRLAPLPSIGAVAMPGSMPDLSADGEETFAVHGTPQNAGAHARARSTAAELGVRAAPAPKKKASRPKPRRDENADPDDLLAEAMDAIGDDGPRPVRLAAGGAGESPSKAFRPHAPSKLATNGADEVSKFMSEEQLMEQILEMTK